MCLAETANNEKTDLFCASKIFLPALSEGYIFPSLEFRILETKLISSYVFVLFQVPHLQIYIFLRQTISYNFHTSISNFTEYRISVCDIFSVII
jgi:hypothetical protein